MEHSVKHPHSLPFAVCREGADLEQDSQRFQDFTNQVGFTLSVLRVRGTEAYRSFYMRKVKFTQDAFHERLDQILTEFPLLDVSPYLW